MITAQIPRVSQRTFTPPTLAAGGAGMSTALEQHQGIYPAQIWVQGALWPWAAAQGDFPEPTSICLEAFELSLG